MFASKTITAHLMRGLIAAALIAWAVVHQMSHPVFALTAGVLAVVAMKGCPLCWTLGLAATIVERVNGRRGHACASGQCSWPSIEALASGPRPARDRR